MSHYYWGAGASSGVQPKHVRVRLVYISFPCPTFSSTLFTYTERRSAVSLYLAFSLPRLTNALFSALSMHYSRPPCGREVKSDTLLFIILLTRWCFCLPYAPPAAATEWRGIRRPDVADIHGPPTIAQRRASEARGHAFVSASSE